MIPRVIALAAILFLTACSSAEGPNGYKLRAIGVGSASATVPVCPDGTALEDMKQCPEMTITVNSLGTSDNFTESVNSTLRVLSGFVPGGGGPQPPAPITIINGPAPEPDPGG